VTTIYIIQASGGSYDDAWERNLFAVADEAEALVAVEKLKAQHEKVKGIFDQVRRFFNESLKELCTKEPDEPQPTPPRGPAKNDKASMAAHHAAYKRWIEECTPIGQRNHARANARVAAAGLLTKAFAAELGADVDDLKMMGIDGTNVGWPSFDGDTHYSYEELELR
jgi:hypothetical protein